MHCCCASSVCQATKPICPSCSLNTLQAPCKQLECHQTPLRAEPLRRSLPLIDEAAKADKGWSTGSAVQVASGQGHSSRPPVSVPVYNGRRWQEMAGVPVAHQQIQQCPRAVSCHVLPICFTSLHPRAANTFSTSWRGSESSDPPAPLHLTTPPRKTKEAVYIS